MLALAIIGEMIKLGVATPVSIWDDIAISKITERVKSNVDDAANSMALTNLSRVLNWAGKHEEALPFAEKAALLMPNIASVRRTHGIILAELGRNTEALPELETAARLDPTMIGLYYHLGLVQQSRDTARPERQSSRGDELI